MHDNNDIVHPMFDKDFWLRTTLICQFVLIATRHDSLITSRSSICALTLFLPRGTNRHNFDFIYINLLAQEWFSNIYIVTRVTLEGKGLRCDYTKQFSKQLVSQRRFRDTSCNLQCHLKCNLKNVERQVAAKIASPLPRVNPPATCLVTFFQIAL